MTKCVHCLSYTENPTKDHIFPKSWYPTNTPAEVERWTVPACSVCNAKLGKVEEELFIRLGMCVDPRKVAASGVPQKVLRALGLGVNVSKQEAAYRAKKLQRMLAEMTPYTGDAANVLPGFGAAQGYDPAKLKQILIPASLVLIFQDKLIRGLEYKFGGQRYIEGDLRLETYNIYENSAPEVDSLINRGFQVTRGPGFHVARAATPEGEVLYRVTIWDSLTVYGSIMKKRNFFQRIMMRVRAKSGQKRLEELARNG